mmetsp:Transcript_11030/g.36544  ORF Transcript_11030/g.36544 Transcript_11030/m.36544 type:complete len:210 (-) Transcript_11030:90-719(-)
MPVVLLLRVPMLMRTLLGVIVAAAAVPVRAVVGLFLRVPVCVRLGILRRLHACRQLLVAPAAAARVLVPVVGLLRSVPVLVRLLLLVVVVPAAAVGVLAVGVPVVVRLPGLLRDRALHRRVHLLARDLRGRLEDLEHQLLLRLCAEQRHDQLHRRAARLLAFQLIADDIRLLARRRFPAKFLVLLLLGQQVLQPLHHALHAVPLLLLGR